MTPEQIDEALQLFQETLRDQPPEDVAQLTQIFALMASGTLGLRDVRKMVQIIRDYYADIDRAKRTPWQIYNMHIGFLAGVCHLLCEQLEEPSVEH